MENERPASLWKTGWAVVRLDPGPGPGEEKRNAAEPPRNSQVFVLRTKETQGGGGGGGGGGEEGASLLLAAISIAHSPELSKTTA